MKDTPHYSLENNHSHNPPLCCDPLPSLRTLDRRIYKLIWKLQWPVLSEADHCSCLYVSYVRWVNIYLHGLSPAFSNRGLIPVWDSPVLTLSYCVKLCVCLCVCVRACVRACVCVCVCIKHTEAVSFQTPALTKASIGWRAAPVVYFLHFFQMGCCLYKQGDNPTFYSC